MIDRDFSATLEKFWRKGRRPLLVTGARQVGKTTLLKSFFSQKAGSLVYLNLEKEPQIREIFEADLNPERILADIRNLGFDLGPDSCLVLDEIQTSHNALNSLKYFSEESTQKVVGAGSLLGVSLSLGSFPVGTCEIRTMHPLSFEEFAKAQHQGTIPYHLPSTMDQLLRDYFYVGGMPKAVDIWVNSKDANSVREEQDQIIGGYERDFAKHAGNINSQNLLQLYHVIAQQLAADHQSRKRFRFKGALPGKKEYAQFQDAFSWLESAGLCLRSFVIESPEYPLRARVNQAMFRAFWHDIGLLGSYLGITRLAMQRSFGSQLGYFVEAFAAGELHRLGIDLYTWKQASAELEFLIQKDEIYPVEVKAGRNRQAKSLQSYIDRYHPSRSFIFTGKDYDVQGKSSEPIPLWLLAKTIREC